jgi:hypothetical protein
MLIFFRFCWTCQVTCNERAVELSPDLKIVIGWIFTEGGGGPIVLYLSHRESHSIFSKHVWWGKHIIEPKSNCTQHVIDPKCSQAIILVACSRQGETLLRDTHTRPHIPPWTHTHPCHRIRQLPHHSPGPVDWHSHRTWPHWPRSPTQYNHHTHETGYDPRCSV